MRTAEEKFLLKYNLLIEYCQKYDKWPTTGLDYPKTDLLVSWLNSIFFKDQTMLDTLGLRHSVSKLYSKYSDTAREYIDRYKKILDYILAHQDVPKRRIKQESEEDRISDKLYSYYRQLLKNSKIKYIVLEDGEYLSDKINNLERQYGKGYKRNTVLKRYRDLEDYCKTYKEWIGVFKKPKNDKEKRARSLHIWLTDNGYFKQNSQCKFSNIVDDDGQSIKEKVDKLHSEYGKSANAGLPHVLDMVDNIRNYCLQYGEFPRSFSIISTTKEELSNKLHNWLNTAKYNYTNDNFRYINVVDSEGKKIKTILDELYLNYNVNLRKKRVVAYVNRIIDFCSLYNKWPRCEVQDDSVEKNLSKRLSSWLFRCKYYTNDFIYKDIMYDNRRTVKEVLDELYKKYSKTVSGTDENKRDTVEKIQKFCENTGRWPRCIRQHKIEQEFIEQKFNSWLKFQKYSINNFDLKFSDIVDENGISLKYKLDFLYSIYSKQAISVYSSGQAKNDIITEVYKAFINMYLALYREDMDSYISYIDLIKSILKESALDINASELCNVLWLSYKDQKTYFFKMYTLCSLQNKEIEAFLFKSLYSYLVMYETIGYPEKETEKSIKFEKISE